WQLGRRGRLAVLGRRREPDVRRAALPDLPSARGPENPPWSPRNARPRGGQLGQHAGGLRLHRARRGPGLRSRGWHQRGNAELGGEERAVLLHEVQENAFVPGPHVADPVSAAPGGDDVRLLRPFSTTGDWEARTPAAIASHGAPTKTLRLRGPNPAGCWTSSR